jgi:hypothetical protein
MKDVDYSKINPYDLVQVGKIRKLKSLKRIRRLRHPSDDPYSTFSSCNIGRGQDGV